MSHIQFGGYNIIYSIHNKLTLFLKVMWCEYLGIMNVFIVHIQQLTKQPHYEFTCIHLS